jgi:HSP20 family protein
VPGVDKDKLQVEAKENTVRISGTKEIKYEEGASVHRRERNFGQFDRTVTIPVTLDPDGIKAEYRDGHAGLVFTARGERQAAEHQDHMSFGLARSSIEEHKHAPA